MRLNERIEIAFSLVGEVDEGLPRTLDHLELTEGLHLSKEVYHLRLDDTGMMPIIMQF